MEIDRPAIPDFAQATHDHQDAAGGGTLSTAAIADLGSWAGSTSITTLGTIGTGTWQGSTIQDAYIASAAAWNGKIDGPGTVGDNQIVIFDGTTGKSVQATTATLTEVASDTTLTATANLIIGSASGGTAYTTTTAARLRSPDATDYFSAQDGSLTMVTNSGAVLYAFDSGVRFGGSGPIISAVIDDDTMATASATTLATSESIKAYADSLAAAAFSADGTTAITPNTAIVLDEATGNETGLLLNVTVNKATSGNATVIGGFITDTASPGELNIFDFSDGGGTIIKMAADSRVLTVGQLVLTGDAQTIGSTASSSTIDFSSNLLKYSNGGGSTFLDAGIIYGDIQMSMFASSGGGGGEVTVTSSDATVASPDGTDFFRAANGSLVMETASVSRLTITDTAITAALDVTVPDEAYGVGWNGSLEVPTKNAVYDKIETISAGSGAFTADGNTLISPTSAVSLTQATGDETALYVPYTVNKATSGADYGLRLNKTDTSSPGLSYLLDLQVAGSSKFNISDTGQMTINNGSVGISSFIDSGGGPSTSDTALVTAGWVDSNYSGGSGDVSKVGTPADGQVGVWTGDGTIEGDADFDFSTTTNTLAIGHVATDGSINLAGSVVLDDSGSGAALQNIYSIDAQTESTIEAAIDALANLTSAASLATVGTITTGTWEGTPIASAYMAAATTSAKGAVELATDGENAANLAVQANDGRLNDGGIIAYIGDGTNVISTGFKGLIPITYDQSLSTTVTIVSEDGTSGSCVLDMWYVSSYAGLDTSGTPLKVADTIISSGKATLSSATKSQTTTTYITDGEKLVKGGWFGFNVDSASGVKRIVVHIGGTKT